MLLTKRVYTKSNTANQAYNKHIYTDYSISLSFDVSTERYDNLLPDFVFLVAFPTPFSTKKRDRGFEKREFLLTPGNQKNSEQMSTKTLSRLSPAT